MTTVTDWEWMLRMVKEEIWGPTWTQRETQKMFITGKGREKGNTVPWLNHATLYVEISSEIYNSSKQKKM